MGSDIKVYLPVLALSIINMVDMPHWKSRQADMREVLNFCSVMSAYLLTITRMFFVLSVLLVNLRSQKYGLTQL